MKSYYQSMLQVADANSSVTPLLIKAIPVRINNVFTYITENYTEFGFEDLVKNAPTLLPTHGVMWFEYDCATTTTAYLCNRIEHKKDSETRWIIDITKYTRDLLDNSREAPLKFRIHLTEQGKVVRDNRGLKIYTASAGIKSISSIEYEKSQLSVILFALSLLNCRNTLLKKDSKAPYYILIIKPVNKEESDRGSRTKALRTIIRKGHLKDYRQGDGLFGKHHALYWWSV